MTNLKNAFKNIKPAYFLFLLSFIIIFNVVQNVAQAKTELVTKVTIEDKIKAADLIKELSKDEKKQLLEIYSQIINQLNIIEKFNLQKTTYLDSRKSIPKEIKRRTAKLENIEIQSKLKQNKLPKIKPNLSLIKLEQLLETASANLLEIEAVNSEHVQELGHSKNSAAKIRKRLIEAAHLLEQLNDDKTSEQSSISNTKREAEQWLSTSQIVALRSEIKTIELQLLTQPIRLKLLELKKQDSDYKLNKATAEVHFLEKQVLKMRKLEAQKTQEMTRSEQIKAQHKHSLIQSFAKLNSQLSQYITLKNKQLTDFELADNQVNLKTKQLSESLTNTKKKLEIAGLNEILGQVLLNQKYKLPNKIEK